MSIGAARCAYDRERGTHLIAAPAWIRRRAVIKRRFWHEETERGQSTASWCGAYRPCAVWLAKLIDVTQLITCQWTATLVGGGGGDIKRARRCPHCEDAGIAQLVICDHSEEMSGIRISWISTVQSGPKK